MICSSLNLDRFIRPSLRWVGLSLPLLALVGGSAAVLSRLLDHRLSRRTDDLLPWAYVT